MQMPPEDLPKPSRGDSLVRGRSDNDHAHALSQSVMLEMQLNSQRQRLDETTLTKLMREADVVIGGTAQGTYEHGKQALTDPATLVKFGTSAILATGLTMAQGKSGLLKLSAQVGSLALAGAFAKDVYGKGEETFGIMKNTWNTPENTEANKKAVGDTLGPFVVDFGIYSAGGAAGIGAGKYASKKFFGGESPTRAFRIEPETAGLSAGKVELATVHTEAPKPGMLSRQSSMAGSTSSELVARPLSKSVNVEGTAGFKPHPGMTAGEVAKGPAELTPVMQSRAMVEIPVVEIGSRGVSVQKFPAQSPLAQTFESASQSLAKIEVLSVVGEKIDARTATAVSLGEGRLVTNHHVTKNASDITIFDQTGKPHKAHTVAFDPAPDLAIVQLRDRSSFDAFAEAKFKNRDGYKAPEETTVVAVGHFDSANHLTASPGVIPHDMRQTPMTVEFQGNIKNGNSGGALYNSEGEVIAIVKADHPNGKGLATPAWQIDRVARHGEQVPPPAVPGNQIQTVSTYDVADIAAAKSNVAKLFDTALEGTKPPEFFHSKVRRVQLQFEGQRPQELVLQTQISPNTREIHIEPISLDGKPIAANQNWPGTLVPIKDSRLSLTFQPGLAKADMHSVNDPLHILQNGFNYRSEGNYLATLVPTTKIGAAGKESIRLH